jgi:tetratricopeptide (TPR) repeat protein
MLFILLLVAPGAAQICDTRTNGAPTPMQVQLTYAAAGAQAPGGVITQNDRSGRSDTLNTEQKMDFANAFKIRVQLQEPIGGTLQEASPTPEGTVRFVVCSRGTYRLRVSGPEIEEAALDDLRVDRGDKLVTIVLHPKLTKEERKALESSVSAARLRVPKKAQKQFDKGKKAWEDGKLDVARAHFERATSIYPQFDEAENDLGLVLMQQGQREAARAAFERSIRANGRYAPALVNLAKLEFDAKAYSEAARLAKQALASEPLSPSALFLAAEATFFQKRFAETIGYAKTLHTLPHSKYALAHYLAAKSLESQGQIPDAVVEYQVFVDEDPSDPNAIRARELIALLQRVLAGPAAQQKPEND